MNNDLYELTTIPLMSIDQGIESINVINPVKYITLKALGYENVTNNEHWNEIFRIRSVGNIINTLYKDGVKVLPEDPFVIYKSMNPDKVNVIICGQDPYPNDKHACGVAFATKDKNDITMSLSNLLGELSNTHLYTKYHQDARLLGWVREQGIFLLNTSLTIPMKWSGRRYIKDSESIEIHRRLWLPFILDTIHKIIDLSPNVICVLLGGVARNSIKNKIASRQDVLTVVHPTASSYGGKSFIGSNIFSEIDKQLSNIQIRIPWCTAISLNSIVDVCNNNISECIITEYCIIMEIDITIYSKLNLSSSYNYFNGIFIAGFVYANIGNINNRIHFHVSNNRFLHMNSKIIIAKASI